MNRRAPVGYVGFVTRAVGLGIDAIVLNVIALVTAAGVSLIAGLFGGDHSLNAVEAAIGGAVWFLWSGVYFVTFWTLTGQTPGDRVLGYRVLPAEGGSIRPMRATRRFIGMIISMIPLGAGFVPVLVDDKRRGLHDRIAGTVVCWWLAQPEELEAVEPVRVQPLTPALGPGPPPTPTPTRPPTPTPMPTPTSAPQSAPAATPAAAPAAAPTPPAAPSGGPQVPLV